MNSLADSVAVKEETNGWAKYGCTALSVMAALGRVGEIAREATVMRKMFCTANDGRGGAANPARAQADCNCASGDDDRP